jgi:aspartyl-tRNA(Asn)/glutamyl-tRNA(Gln) amidotransferase subunit A
LVFLSIGRVAPLLRAKKISPVELTESVLARIEKLNPRLNAYITVIGERARADARRAEREIVRGRCRGPLQGVPISIKDNIWVRGVRCTAGSKILADFVPAEDATVVRRLARAGAVLVGKTNLHEFAYGITSENPHYGPARNPWAQDRITGGSSGGSVAALAAGLCFASIGTDTGGSIRIPAALCGVAGLKPTFGRVSSYGVVPLAHSLDHVGPLARAVGDLAILLQIISGRDLLDPAAAAKPVPGYLQALRGRLGRLRLGWPRDYFFERVDEQVRLAIESAARVLTKLGAQIEEVSLPHVAGSAEPSTHIALAEARHFHETAGYFPARAVEYGEDVRKLLDKGGSVSAVDYLKALEMQQAVRSDFQAAFARVDAILAPAVPVAAPRLGESILTVGGDQETVRSALIRLNRPGNLTGLPAISVPCGFTRDGLPIGLQLIGPAWGEERLLQIAHAYEQATDWHTRRPVDG